ncbi:hypothetical protein NA57DRAFT_47447 [Rhizodiscina lignyota]|uniref:Protein FYV10 n=1 Tax=Rhizodiscina lignyota TaxID=1504668 RepID=A0A9P4I713_9PEZI|nr:hypothetical protein NA57DRAFT_47447 [Rhizodiscina lignyota]
MAAELTTIKLNPDEHLLLDQPVLRLPAEVNRSNLKSAQIAIDQAKKAVVPAVNSATSAALSASGNNDQAAQKALASLDSMIQKTNVLKRKLSAISASTDSASASLGARVRHLNELHSIPSLADVKYDEWSRTRLDRLLVDYLLRMGYLESAKGLAKAKDIEDLVRVEIEAFEACGKIEKSLRNKSTKEALVWCGENRKELQRVESELEFELRFQQYTELIRKGPGHRLETLTHAKKYLSSHKDQGLVMRAAGLMAFSSDVPFDPQRSLFSDDRWNRLADIFVQTHHQLFSIPPVPLLHTALSAGLTALKTPACHSKNNPNSSSLTDSAPSPICPICSTELNALARNVPYATHNKSHVDPDPVVLPNGRIYGSERLRRANEKLGTEKGRVRDPLDGSEFDEMSVKKVFIS